jgi:hypothetical protein
LIEAMVTEVDLADGEQRPPLADDLQRKRDRAGPSRNARSGCSAGLVARWFGAGHLSRFAYPTDFV